MVEPELLEILRCPRCHGELRVDEEAGGLACDRDRLLYPVVDGIPVMLIEEARPF